MATDLTVYLEDRPGTIAEAGEALGAAGINIQGACGFPSDGRGVLHLLVDDADASRAALEAAGLEVGGQRPVVVSAIEDRPREMGRVLRRVADAGVNVDLVYLTHDGRMVIGASDVDAAEKAIGG